MHFGIVMILNLGIGLADAAGRADDGGRLRDRQSVDGGGVARILVFYIPMLIVLALVTYIPALTLWLPKLLLG